MTRAETWTLLADWIEDMRDRFRIRTIDDLLEKVKELEKQSGQAIEKKIVDSLEKELTKSA